VNPGLGEPFVLACVLALSTMIRAITVLPPGSAAALASTCAISVSVPEIMSLHAARALRAKPDADRLASDPRVHDSAACRGSPPGRHRRDQDRLPLSRLN